MGLILLGENYLNACRPDSDLRYSASTLLFVSTKMAGKLPSLPNQHLIALNSKQDPGRFHCGQINIKGELGGRLLKGIAADTGLIQTLQTRDNVLELLAKLPPAKSPMPTT